MQLKTLIVLNILCDVNQWASLKKPLLIFKI